MSWIFTDTGKGINFKRQIETITKKNNGFSVQVENYLQNKKITFSIYDSFLDLLKSNYRWNDLIYNYLPITRQFYIEECLIPININRNKYFVRGFYNEDFNEWIPIIEFSSNSKNSIKYIDWYDLKEKDAENLIIKYNSFINNPVCN